MARGGLPAGKALEDSAKPPISPAKPRGPGGKKPRKTLAPGKPALYGRGRACEGS